MKCIFCFVLLCLHLHTRTHTHIYVYLHLLDIYLGVFMHVCIVYQMHVSHRWTSSWSMWLTNGFKTVAWITVDPAIQGWIHQGWNFAEGKWFLGRALSVTTVTLFHVRQSALLGDTGWIMREVSSMDSNVAPGVPNFVCFVICLLGTIRVCSNIHSWMPRCLRGCTSSAVRWGLWKIDSHVPLQFRWVQVSDLAMERGRERWNLLWLDCCRGIMQLYAIRIGNKDGIWDQSALLELLLPQSLLSDYSSGLSPPSPRTVAPTMDDRFDWCFWESNCWSHLVN